MVNFAIERAKDKEAQDNPKNVRNAFKEYTLQECVEHCKSDRLPFDACLLNVTSDLNVSASVRTLHLMGAGTIYIVGKRKLDRRAMVGAEFYQNTEYLDGLDFQTLHIDPQVIHSLSTSKENYLPVFVEMGGTPLQSVDWKSSLQEGALRPLLIFGNEHRGIGPEILKLQEVLPRSLCVSIPMFGVLRSLNVSASVAAVTWDLISKAYPHYLQEE